MTILSRLNQLQSSASGMIGSEITRLRLLNQQIALSQCKTAHEVVSTLGAIQAQDYSAALWAIGLRLPGSTEDQIRQSIANRQIVRTWPMRGTLHFIPAEDIRWMLELLAPRVIAASATRHRNLELGPETFSRCRGLIISALQGQKLLTRDEIYCLLEKANISTAQQRGYHILWKLAQEGLICFGPHAGKQQTFVLLDDWVPNARRLDRTQALTQLTLRYFSGHGPATAHDFAWWSGLPMVDVKLGLELATPQLVQEEINGRRFWSGSETASLRKKPDAVFLLPAFDEYLLGYKDRSACLDLAHAQQVIPGNNGMFMPTIVLDGRIVGTWKRTLKKKTVDMKLDLFDSTTRIESDQFRAAAAQYGRFLALESSTTSAT